MTIEVKAKRTETVTLTLDGDEARALGALLGNVGGPPGALGYRVCSSIWQALNAAGIVTPSFHNYFVINSDATSQLAAISDAPKGSKE